MTAGLRAKLKSYEDTGITPKQLKEIDKLYSEQAKELAELREAIKNGKKTERENK